MRVTFLGTGTSVGVPVVGCRCRVCTSEDPRNRRLRQSVWIREGDTSLLIDAAVDLREQALRHGIRLVDAFFLTHAHADHILGLDETRVFAYWQKGPVKVYGSPATLEGVRRTFWYAFSDVPEGGGRPRLSLIPLDGPVRVGTLDVIPVEGDHGSMPVTGYRIGRFAYLTDCKRVPDATAKALAGVDTLVLNALRHGPEHSTHMTVAEALAAAEAIGPRRTFLVHMGHELDHSELAAALPPGIAPAYDGLVLEFGNGDEYEGEVE